VSTLMRALSEQDLFDSSACATFKLTNREGTTEGRSVPSGVTCGLRLSAVGMQPHELPDRCFSFCRYALGREGPFEGYCSEGVEHFEYRARVIVRQRYSLKMSS